MYARKLRGTISAREWGLWRGANGPEDWQPFERWRETHKADLRRASAEDVQAVVDDLLKKEDEP